MRYHLIYFIDYKKNDVVSIKDQYSDKNDANKNIERIAIEYVKEMQGKQQAEICKQDKTPEQIQLDATLKEGMYIKKSDDSIILYEKITVVQPGFVFNSNIMKVNKIGLFGLNEYNFDESMITRCSCSSQRKPIPINKKSTHGGNQALVDELRKLIGDTKGKFKLKPVNNHKKSDHIMGNSTEVIPSTSAVESSSNINIVASE